MKLDNDKVILKVLTQTTSGGLFMPGYKEGLPFLACEVVETGPGIWNEYKNKYAPMDIKVGDKVVVNILSTRDISSSKYKGDKYVIVETAEECCIKLDEGEEI